MIFASVFIGEDNIVFKLLEAGMGQIQYGQDKSEHIDEMKTFEKVASEAKKGIWKEGQNPVRIVDNTEKGKAKQFWNFLDKEKKFAGVIEQVISG